MDVSRALLLVALGLVLVAANVAYVRALLRVVAPRASASQIAPFQVLGSESTADGAALAHMLVARLGDIEQRMSRVQSALERSRAEGLETLRQDRPQRDHLTTVPTVFVPLNFDVKVGGVEVGGIVSWVQRQLARDAMLQVSVHLGDAKSRVGGNWIGQRSEPFWSEIDGASHEAIVDAVAYQIAYRTFVERVPEAGALTPAELQILLDELIRLVDLKRRLQLGRRTDESEFAEVLDGVWELVTQAPNWSDFQLLAADIAEHAGDKERAVLAYRAALDATEDDARHDPRLRDKIAALEKDVLAESGYDPTSRVAQVDPVTEDPGGTEAEPEDPGPQLDGTLPAVRRIREMLGVENLTMSRPVRIAMPGVPERRQAGDAVIGNPSPTEGMAEYVANVSSVVRLVAPKVEFLYGGLPSTRGGALTIDMLLRSSAALTSGDAAPDLLLLPYGPLPANETRRLLSALAERGIPTVITAGNEAGKPLDIDGSDPSLGVLVAAAVDLDGNRADFSQYGPGCVWAPGATIPVRTRGEGVRVESGTSYSAALTAGLAARVLAEHPDLAPAELVSAMQRGAVRPQEGAPEILDLRRTLSLLSE